MEVSLKFVGTVHSPLKRLEDCPLLEHEEAPVATLEIYEPFGVAAKDLKPGKNIIVLTWLDKGDREVLTTHPRNNPNSPVAGVFSTRSPDRPNPIGIHFVTITETDGLRVNVSGLEVLDQTPIVDIKPDLR